MTIGGIIAGIFFIALGVLLVYFNFWLGKSLGSPQFVHRFFGPGKEYSFYKALGVIVIILGMMVATGLHSIILNIIFSPLKGILQI